MARDLILEARGVSKHYGGAIALDQVDFELGRGEIHGLLGENGAGKSTLIKILAGVVPRDGGDILVEGAPLPLRFTGSDALAAGLAFVHQDLGLVETLSVAENIALATHYVKRRGLISFARTEKWVKGLLDALSVEVSPRALVGDLDQDVRVMVAVARAFALEARAIVLDEVSSSLPAPVVARLADALRASRASGVSYVYVTHRLDELPGFVDRVTVLRNGRTVATESMDRVEHDQLVRWIIGDAPVGGTGLTGSQPVVRPEGGRAALEVNSLVGPGHVGPVGFTAQPGEIIGICGLVGSGTHEVAEMLGGSLVPVSGGAALAGEPLPLGDTHGMREAGCTYVPGNRQREGAVMTLSVQENMFLARRRSTDRGLVATRRERTAAQRLAERFVVRPAGVLDWPLSSLSGGNQQKVVMARALRGEPRLLVVDDPTSGVDIGSRAELHRILRKHAATGAVVVLISTDFDEVASLSDRAIVMRAGRPVAELSGDDLTADRLATASYGVTQDTTKGAGL